MNNLRIYGYFRTNWIIASLSPKNTTAADCPNQKVATVRQQSTGTSLIGIVDYCRLLLLIAFCYAYVRDNMHTKFRFRAWGSCLIYNLDHNLVLEGSSQAAIDIHGVVMQLSTSRISALIHPHPTRL